VASDSCCTYLSLSGCPFIKLDHAVIAILIGPISRWSLYIMESVYYNLEKTRFQAEPIIYSKTIQSLTSHSSRFIHKYNKRNIIFAVKFEKRVQLVWRLVNARNSWIFSSEKKRAHRCVNKWLFVINQNFCQPVKRLWE